MRIACQIEYHHVHEADSDVATNPPAHLKTLAQNMLDLLDDPEDADVTLHVRGQEIKAHKAILTARSDHFRSVFKSGMKESISKEIELDDDPTIFKELLRFLYSGLLPENLDQIAMDLLPIADKYAVEELKRSCDLAIRRNLSAKNIVQVMRLAEDYHCPDLFQYAAPVFKAKAKDLEQSTWDELEEESIFLSKLLKVFTI